MIKLFPLRLIPENTKIDFMGTRKLNFLISIILILCSIGSMCYQGMNFGIDFSGGVLIEAKFNHNIDLPKIHKSLDHLNIGEIKIQDFEGNNIMIRVGNSTDANIDINKAVDLIKDSIRENYSKDIEFRKTEYVGPQVGKELVKKGALSVALAFLAIMSYIALRFEWQYGIGILIALIHDTIVSLGIMSFSRLEFDLTTVAAILTIIGYSVNDSVVIYDRIRENFGKYEKKTINSLINLSINETLSRTILTVVTTLISVAALIIYGGPALKSFSVLCFSGILVGTYSSIYISAPILIYFNLKNKREKSAQAKPAATSTVGKKRKTDRK